MRHSVFHPSVDGKAITINSAVTNGVKTAIATSASAVSYATTALNGALMDGTLGKFAGGIPRAVSVTTGASVGTYRTGASYPIRVTGQHWRTLERMTESLLLTAANGGETINGNVMFSPDYPISISIPGQVDASGTFAFGCTIATAIEPPAHSIVVNSVAAGTALYYRLSRAKPASAVMSAVIGSAGEERAWEVAEIHIGTTVASINAHYGTPQRGE